MISKRDSWNPAASVLLAVFLFTAHAGIGLYSARHLTPSPSFSLLYYLALAGLITYWVHCDRLRRHEASPVDQGFVVYATWPLALPWYLVSTRGLRRGLAAIVLFLLAFTSAHGISLLVFFIASGAK